MEIKPNKKKVSSTTTLPKRYGNYNFEMPTESTIFRVIGKGKLEGLSSKEEFLFLNDYKDYYQDLPIPTPGSWLWDHKELGQSTKTYLIGSLNQPSKSYNTIYLKNLDEGMDSFINDDMLNHLSYLLEIFYPGIKVKQLNDKNNLDKLGIDKRQNGYLQYNASIAVGLLKNLIPKDGLLIVGVTSYDLYPRDDWNYVFGLANKQEGCGVFSFRRYYDEIESGLKGSKDDLLKLVSKIAGKVMLHEVGHLFNLSHCVYFNCIMNGVNNYEENLKQWFEFCPVCLRKLCINLKFDVIERFKGIISGLNKLSPDFYKTELVWYNRRLENLTK